MKKTDVRTEEPTTQKEASPPPVWLSETARGIWGKVSADLVTLEIYDMTLDELLAAYCAAMGSLIDASSRGESPQPALLSQIRGLAVSLGIDPQNRKKLQPKPPGVFDDMPFM